MARELPPGWTRRRSARGRRWHLVPDDRPENPACRCAPLTHPRPVDGDVHQRPDCSACWRALEGAQEIDHDDGP